MDEKRYDVTEAVRLFVRDKMTECATMLGEEVARSEQPIIRRLDTTEATVAELKRELAALKTALGG